MLPVTVKNDLIVSIDGENRVLVLSNLSTAGNIALGAPVNIPVSSPGGFITSCDIDQDGKPEIIRANPQSNSVSILHNGQPSAAVIDIALCANAGTSLNAGLTGSTYQWQLNTGSGFNNISNNTNFNGTATATLQLTNIPASWNGYQLQCVVNSTLTGPIYKLNMTVSVTPAITISGGTVLQTGQSSSISTSVVNGGPVPAYQWQDSTSLHSWLDIAGATGTSLNYTPANSGDRLRCRLTSNATCPNPIQVNSNVLQFTLTPVTAIDPVNSRAFGIRYYPNPTDNILYIDSLKLSDRWNTLTVVNMGGARAMTDLVIFNRTTVSLNVQAWPAGYYLVILQRKKGAPVYLKFLKE